MIERIISGAQTGVEVASLAFAKREGMLYGGSMPKGYLTEDGRKVGYNLIYNMEMYGVNYLTSSVKNIKDADATLFILDKLPITKNKNILRKTCWDTSKPWLIVAFEDGVCITDIHDWIEEHQIKSLHITGTTESESPGIKTKTVAMLARLSKTFKK